MRTGENCGRVWGGGVLGLVSYQGDQLCLKRAGTQRCTCILYDNVGCDKVTGIESECSYFLGARQKSFRLMGYPNWMKTSAVNTSCRGCCAIPLDVLCVNWRLETVCYCYVSMKWSRHLAPTIIFVFPPAKWRHSIVVPLGVILSQTETALYRGAFCFSSGFFHLLVQRKALVFRR